MSRSLVVVCLLSCFLPFIVGQSWLTPQIIYQHFDNGNCYPDNTAVNHYWYNNTCAYDHLISTGPLRYIQARIISNRTIQLCVSSTGCYYNSTCNTYPTNQCLWDLAGTSWRLSLAASTPTSVPTPTQPPTPTPSPNSTLIFTHYNNRYCYYDSWTFSHTWYSGVCTVDHLDYTGNYTSIKATVLFGTSVQLCTYSDAFMHCDNFHNPQCMQYNLNTCFQVSPTGWIKFTLASNPNPTPAPTPYPTNTPTIRPTLPPTQPPIIWGGTVTYTSYADNYCGILSQSQHNWYNGSCIVDTFDYYYYYGNVNILPRIISASMVELCIHYDPVSHCVNDASSCRLYSTNMCIMNPSGRGTFRLQVPGVPTIAPTPYPTSIPTPTRTPGSLLVFSHFDDFSCSVLSPGYPRVWNQNSINYENIGGQLFPFNATVRSPIFAFLCLQLPSETTCQLIALGQCLNGPSNSGMFMLQIMNGSIPTTVPTVAPTSGPSTPSPTARPTAYPIGATNIKYSRFLDDKCEKQDTLAGEEIYVNGKCDNKLFNNELQQVRANLLAGAKSVEFCTSPTDCIETNMACKTVKLDTCQQDPVTFLSFRYSISGVPTSSPESSSSGLSTGVLIGLIIGGIVGIIILGLIIYCYRKHRQQTKQDALHMQQDGGYTRV